MYNTSYLKNYKDDQSVSLKHKLVQDTTLQFCHVLLPFDLVQKDGFIVFLNVSCISSPSDDIL